ncbi:serine/threonine-protein kinase [uncultured Paludibaculum sp.]|uniref:serine/threonine-protein kinase n=1 Tax=uncultured Paludibaculum sp. TaxID=1765020 RepID=UPI002AAABD41|nr:serine/threonine-protein kinase [uncultured Paludibaculum sp.]
MDVAPESLGFSASSSSDYCGPYRLIRLLGSGGMGAVYLAERTDGEIQQSVAIKLLRAGHDLAWRAGFLREREILASLNHPSIVRVKDAGHTHTGQPFLVMEYVEGDPIDVYCAGLDLQRVVLLFLSVCDAVAHAHQHLIIHRDLKPSNILVDSSGHPKLLDFGIARLLESDGGTAQTQELLATPSYASPEQMRGASQTTATDIYSLGAVLHKLLTGRSPHESDVHATQDQLKTDGARNFPTDLDHILRKATRLEPEERYTSVRAFAEDLRAFLESKPVEARSGNNWYRARRFMRRFWIQATSAAAVVASLTIGLILAQQQRAVAERRFADVRGFAAAVLDVEKSLRDTPGSLEARKYLVTSVVESLDRLSAEVHRDMSLRAELAAAYLRVAEVQAQRSKSSFGLHREALASLRKAEGLLNEVRAAEPWSPSAAHTWWTVQSEITDRLYDIGEKGGSVQHATQTADELAKYLEHSTGSEAEQTVVSRIYAVAARSLLNAGRTAEALRYSGWNTAIATARARRLRTPEAQVYAASSLRVHGTTQRYAGELDQALESLDKATAELPRDPENQQARRERQDIAYVRGLVLGEAGGLSLGRFTEGARSLREASGILHAIIAENPSDAEARVNLAQTALKLGQILLLTNAQSALDTFGEGLQGLTAAPESNRYVTEYRLKLNLESSIALAKMGKHTEGRSKFDAAVAVIRGSSREGWPPKRFGSSSVGETIWRAQAELAAAAGRSRDAATIYQEALRLIRAGRETDERTDLDNAVRTSLKLARIADLLSASGDEKQAGEYRRERLELWRHWKTNQPANTVVQRQLDAATHPVPERAGTLPTTPTLPLTAVARQQKNLPAIR